MCKPAEGTVVDAKGLAVFLSREIAKNGPRTMTNPVIHETERLTLHTWELDDFDALAELARDPQVMRYIADGKPWPDSRIGWCMGLQRGFQHGLGYCFWKVLEKETKALVGLCGLAPEFKLGETEIGWWLKPSHWGRGYAFEAAQCAGRAAFEDHGLDRYVARVYAENAPSIRLVEKLGMAYVRDLDTTPVGTVRLYEKVRS